LAKKTATACVVQVVAGAVGGLPGAVA